MSSVDERIVEMRFDNAQFEQGVKESLKTLDKLKLGLDLGSSAKSLESLEKTVNGFTMRNIGDSAVRTAESFSFLYRLGSSFIGKLADSAADAGIRIAKSLSIDNIGAGFSKYEQQTKAVQTILNNVENSTMADAEALIHKLMWYTDETSYSFDSMITNIGKFTSAGIDLDVASKSMIGIANACGLAGVETEKASHAMDGFSKAMAAGYMSYQNWSWIKTAGLDTKAFKEELIQAGVATGKLKKTTKKNGEEVYKTAKKTEVTYANLTETLSEKWLTTDVMNMALGKFADYTEEVFKIAEEEGITASEAMERYSGEVGSLGEKAFKAAQEARTFTDALNSVKDAVSSKFAAGFDIIFGNYEESKKTWTYLANYLWDVFAWPLDKINVSLREWKDLGGFADLFSVDESNLGGFYNYLEEFKKYIDAFDELTDELLFGPLEEASRTIADTVEPYTREFDELKNKITKDSNIQGISKFANALWQLTRNVKRASVEFTVSDEAVEQFKNTIRNTITVVQSIFRIFGALGTYVSKTFGLFREGASVIMPDLGKGITDIIGGLDSFSKALKKNADEFEYSQDTVTFVQGAFKGFFKVLSAGGKIIKGAGKLIMNLSKYSGTVSRTVKKALGFVAPFAEKAVGWIGALADKFFDWAENADLVEKSVQFIDTLSGKLESIWETISKFGASAFNAIADVIESLTGYDIRKITWDDVAEALNKVKDALIGIVPLIKETTDAFGKFIAPFVTSAFTGAADVLSGIWKDAQKLIETIKNKPESGKKNIITSFIEDLKSGKISVTNFLNNLDGLSTIREKFSKGWEKLTKIFDNFNVKESVVAFLGTSLGILNIAFSDAATKIGAFFVSITGLTGALKKFVNTSRTMKIVRTAIFGIIAVILALTAALAALAYIASKPGGTEALKTAKDTLMDVLIVVGVVVLIMGILSKIPTGDKLGATFIGLGAFMFGIAAVMLAFTSLTNLKPEQTKDGILALVEILAVLWVAVLFMGPINSLLTGNKVNFASILAFAIGIAILAHTLKMLSKIPDPAKLWQVVGPLAVIMGAFAILIAAAAAIPGTTKGIGTFGVIAALILSFMAISYAIKQLGDTSKTATQIAGLVTVVMIVLFFMLAVSAAIGKSAPTIAKGVGLFVGIAGSILLLALALAVLSTIPESAWANIGPIIGLFVGLSVLATVMSIFASKKAGTGNVGLSVLAIAASVMFLAAAFKLMQDIDTEHILDKALALGVIMFAFGLMGMMANNITGAPKAILALATSILIMVAALALLSLIPEPAKLWKVVGPLSIIMAVFSLIVLAASALPSKGVLGPMIMMVLIIAELAAALFILSEFSSDTTNLLSAAGAMAISMLAMAAALVLIGVLVNKIGGNKVLAAAAALVVVSLAFIAISKALQPLAQLPWQNTIGAAGSLAIVLLAMAAALYIVGNFAKLWGLVAAVAFIGIAVAALIAAAGLMAWVDALNAFAGEGSTDNLATWLSGIISAFKANNDELVSTINEGTAEAQAAYDEYDQVVARGGGGGGSGRKYNRGPLEGMPRPEQPKTNTRKSISDYVSEWLSSKILNGLTAEQYANAQNAGMGAVDIGVPINANPVMTNNQQKSFTEGLKDLLINNIIGSVKDGAQGLTSQLDLRSAMSNAIAGTEMESVFKDHPEILGELFSTEGIDLSQYISGDGASNLVEMFSSALLGSGGDVSEASTSLVSSAMGPLTSSVPAASGVGSDFGTGYAQGILNGKSLVVTNATALGIAAVEALRRAQQSQSPSKLTYQQGMFFDQGYGNAIGDYARVSETAAKNMGEGTLAALRDSFDTMDGIANGKLVATPTVRPVVDSSAIQNGARSMELMSRYRQSLSTTISTEDNATSSEISALTGVARAILGAVQAGHELHLDVNQFVEVVDRGLGGIV